MKNSYKNYIVVFLLPGIVLLVCDCRNQSRQLTLITTDIYEVTETSALSGGTIANTGGSTITAKGICWSTIENPTIENNRTIELVDSLSFKSILTDLMPGKKYFLRAYATNKTGTFYGNTLSFNTLNSVTVNDAEGYEYKTITIGSQTWMAENLNTTFYKDGSSIPLVTDDSKWAGLTSPACCWYKNEEESFRPEYGTLYNWYAVNTGKLCPEGWHIPGDAEWTILANYLGGEGLAGGKMKEPGVTYWVDPNNGATNSSGFTALPGGFRYFDGKFFDLGFSGYWWSSSQYNEQGAWFRFLYYENSNLYRFSNNIKNGFSVRCLKD